MAGNNGKIIISKVCWDRFSRFLKLGRCGFWRYPSLNSVFSYDYFSKGVTHLKAPEKNYFSLYNDKPKSKRPVQLSEKDDNLSYQKWYIEAVD